jgi:hypothetical protein
MLTITPLSLASTQAFYFIVSSSYISRVQHRVAFSRLNDGT